VQSKHAGEKLDKIANVIIFVQIIMTIFNVIFGFWAGSQYYLYGLFLSGMLIRAAIQTIVMLWLIKKEKNFPKNSTAWWILLCCLASGFTNIFSSYSSFHWGNLEIILIVCGIILLFRHYSYIKAIRIEYEEKKMEEQEK
jgi:hypothetical protein